MADDRKIGTVVRVKTFQVLIELQSDTGGSVKSSQGGLYSVGVINSFVIIPVGSLRVVGVVTSLDMSEDHEANFRSQQLLVLPVTRRTMWVSLVGTISQSPKSNGRHFDFGVSRYPLLDNPVWYAAQEDLDVIFDRVPQDEERQKRLITIGRSPLFSDYEVRIDMDSIFGKHAAILGNTGSGKSCTVAALINAVLNKGGGKALPHAHFIVFDTNAEYESAFTQVAPAGAPSIPLHNRLVISNNEDAPTGFWIPHWFMNGRDYLAFFRPGEGAQAPLLHRAISVARATGNQKSTDLHRLSTIEDSLNGIEGLLSDPPSGNAAAYGLANLRSQIEALNSVLTRWAASDGGTANGQDFASYQASVQRMLAAAQGTSFARIDANVSDQIRPELIDLRRLVASEREGQSSDGDTPIGIDTPCYFDFDDFVLRILREEIAREARHTPNLRNWVGSLLMRLEQVRLDPRYSFLLKPQRFDHALASFLRLMLGVDPGKHFETEGAKPPWADHYLEQVKAEKMHNVTILDFSQLASDVLENVTALLGRLILEFAQRCPNRGKYPIVLILEEAHRYIPANAPLERQQRAREVFERIAKEGRKFGLSLVVASQRPSELSPTVLAQCNSFIVHRIQNPDDLEYFRSVVSAVNRDLLDQLPSLPQQHALLMGECVTVPLQVRINDVDPKPDSHNPQFHSAWSDPKTVPPDFEVICAKWEAAPRSPSSSTIPESPDGAKSQASLPRPEKGKSAAKPAPKSR